MVILKYHLTEEEFFDFNYYTGWAAPNKKRYRTLYVARFVTYYIIIAELYLLAVGDFGSISGLVIFGTPAVAFIFLVPWLVKRATRQRIRAVLSKPENKHVLSAAEVMIMDTGIIDKDEAMETKYSWDAIISKAETPTAFYLYTNSYHAIVIPKRALLNAQEKQELQRLFNQHLPLSSEFESK